MSLFEDPFVLELFLIIVSAPDITSRPNENKFSLANYSNYRNAVVLKSHYNWAYITFLEQI